MSFRTTMPTVPVDSMATQSDPHKPVPHQSVTLHSKHVSWVLFAAFTLSVIHTVYASINGLEDPDFTLTTPTTYVFYALGFASVALARRPGRAAQLVLLGYLVIVVLIGLFYYLTRD